jgi:hypothetical protein
MEEAEEPPAGCVGGFVGAGEEANLIGRRPGNQCR